jgi:hypothetical protein
MLKLKSMFVAIVNAAVALRSAGRAAGAVKIGRTPDARV